MMRLLSNTGLIFAGMVSVPAIVTYVDIKSPPLPPLPPAAGTADRRLSLLQHFFETNDAPAKRYSHVFITEADEYNLDWRLLPSISFVETTGGKSAPNNNLFGWDCGRAVFKSIAEGIHTVAYQLGRSTLYRNKELDEVLWVYNPNPEYRRTVKSVMAQIAPVE